MGFPTYEPREPLVIDLRDFICRCSKRADCFNAAIATARNPMNGGLEEMDAEHIVTLDNYLEYCDNLLRWIPRVSSKGDELLRKLLVFYWALDQPILRHFQTPIEPTSSNVDLSWLSYWLVSFARDMGQFLSTPESAGLIYTFYLNENYNKEAAL
jgi:hypothetical protein